MKNHFAVLFVLAPVSATIQSVGTHEIKLVAHSVTDDVTSVIYYTMKANGDDGYVPPELYVVDGYDPYANPTPTPQYDDDSDWETGW